MKKLNDINFILGQGGSGRTANGTDYISGLMFYNSSRPAAFVDNVTAGGVHQIFSPDDAINIGINDLLTDETKSTATYQITAVGSNGDTLEAKVAEWTSGVGGKGTVSLGVYTKVSGDTTATLVAVGLAAAINLNTSTHGYVATSSTDTVTITARPGMGVYLNSGTPYTKTIVGTIAATIVQNVVAGVASKLAVYYYHIVRYFAVKPDGTLYIGIFDTTAHATFADIDTMITYSQGSIVQLGIWDDQKVYALASLTLIQGRLDGLRTAHKICSTVTYAADIKALSTPLTSLAGASYNLATLSAKNVSDCIDNDGNAVGFDLFKQVGKTISSLGAQIGCISESAISEDIGNAVDRFNCDDGLEFDTLMFGDGTFYNNVSSAQLDALNNNRHIFLSKIAYANGSWYSDNHSAIAYTSDYAYQNDNRVIDRVIKDSFIALTPILKSRLKLNTDGTMTASTIAYLIAIESQVIKPLIASDDLAGDANNFDGSKWVIINPLQKPNVASKLIIGVKLAENAIARSIEVPIGFGTF